MLLHELIHKALRELDTHPNADHEDIVGWVIHEEIKTWDDTVHDIYELLCFMLSTPHEGAEICVIDDWECRLHRLQQYVLELLEKAHERLEVESDEDSKGVEK